MGVFIPAAPTMCSADSRSTAAERVLSTPGAGDRWNWYILKNVPPGLML